MRPIVLSIAGSDSSAGAGIQADLKAIEANGGYAATVVTAVTAQNTRTVRRVVALEPQLVRDQLEAVFEDLPVAAVKTGMLGDAGVVGAVAQCLVQRRPPVYVCDPLLRSTAGAPLLTRDGLDALRAELLPLATLATPNVAEAEELTGRPIRDLDDAEAAADEIRGFGPRAVLITGGHLRAAPATDILIDADGATRFNGPYVKSEHTHGTGCVLSAAIATRLAHGLPLRQAIARAKRFVLDAIRHGLPLGGGSGPTDPLFRLHERRPG